MGVLSLPRLQKSRAYSQYNARLVSSNPRLRLRRLVHETLETRYAPAGLALYLDGVDDYAAASDNITLDLGVGQTEDLTVETMFYVASPPLGNKTLVYKQNAYALFFNEHGTFFRIWTGPASDNFYTLQAAASPGVGWHHIAGVFDNEFTATNDLVALYLDGLQLATSTGMEVTPGINNSASPIHIGGLTTVNPFHGWIEETRLSDVVRYNGTYTVPTSALAPDANTRALWHFDEDTNSPTGPLFADVSGNNNTLTGANGTQTANPPSTDTTPPTITSLTPADNAVSVSVTANLVLSFGESIQKGSGNIVIKRSSDASIVQTIAVSDAAVTASGFTATINPNDFLDATGYYVEVVGGAFQDLAGNPFAGITGPTTWNFHTGDTTGPMVLALSPADNATGVALTANLVLTFGEPVQKGSGSVLIKRSSDNSVVQTIEIGDSAVTVVGSTVTINTNDFVDTTGYFVEVTTGAIRDLAGNNFTGITGANMWNFTTGVTGNSILTVIGQTYSGSTGNEQGTGIAVLGSGANTQVFTSGLSDALTGEGLVHSFGLPNAQGNIPVLWSSAWPGAAGIDQFHGIEATSTDLFLAGSSYSRTTDNLGSKEQKGITVSIAPASGTVRWATQTPGAPGAFAYGGFETAYDTAITVENGNTFLYTTGMGQSNGLNGGRMFLAKLNSAGNILWNQTDSSVTPNSSGLSVLAFGGSIYTAGGNADSGADRAYIKKYAPDGALAWAKTSALGAFNSVIADSTGNALFAVGSTFGTNANFLIEKWDLAGNVLWSRTYDRSAAQDILYSAAVWNGRVYAVGSTRGGTAGGLDGVLLELDPATGTLMQTRLWGGSADDSFTDIGVSSDRLHVVGSTNSFGAGGSDVAYVVYGNSSIQLSVSSVNENAAAGGIVGGLSLTEVVGSPTFTLVSGVGSSDNASFSIDASGNLSTAAVFNYESKASYAIRVRATVAGGQFVEQPLSISVVDLPELAGPVVLGNGTNQHSLVDKITILMDGPVTVESGAFSLTQRGTNALVTTQVTQSTTPTGQTQLVLTFSGALTRGVGALLDGYYLLNIDGLKLRRGLLSADLNGDGSGGDSRAIGAAESDNFFALYGDTNGDGLVGIAEFGEFRAAFGKASPDAAYNAIFDYDQDGAIGISDFGQFRSRFGKPKLPF